MGVRWRLAGSGLCLESGSVSIEGRERACHACVTCVLADPCDCDGNEGYSLWSG